jgi:large subunit ribosomal protein L15e
MGYTKYVKRLYENKESMKDGLGQILVERKKTWRKQAPIVRVEKPTRIDKARQYGYRSKQGFVILRVKVRRGGLRKKRPSRGRKPAGMAIRKITMAKSTQRMAEERAQKKSPNLQVLASYWVLDDGKNKWYEVIMVDTHHPAMKKDRKISWMGAQGKKRVFKGLTPAGKKGRGLRNRGKGAEKVRPSIRAKNRLAK